MFKKYGLILLTFLSFTLFTGCRANSSALTPDAANITLGLSVAPNPPIVGESTLIVSLHDADGQPIDDATINIRGDMNHAGMIPVLRESDRATDGDYLIPFEWTMGGDWFVVVTVTLSNGTLVEQAFPYTVTEGDTQ